MKPVAEFIGTDMGLYDSATNKSLKADHAIDVSDLCPESKQMIIKYCNTKRGRIAQLNDLYEKGKDLGAGVHYFISEMTPLQLASDSVFASRCNIIGAVPLELAETIFEYSEMAEPSAPPAK